MNRIHDLAVTQDTLRNVGELRDSLLRLHKLLLDMERTSYEAQHGPQRSGEMLKLLIENEHFAWLRRISELIVRIDEFLEDDEKHTAEAAREFFEYTRELLIADQSGNAFQMKYDAALQNNVDVIFAHRETLEILARSRQA